MGLPLEGVGVLIALDAVPDIFKTILNVTGHLTAATVVVASQKRWTDRDRASPGRSRGGDWFSGPTCAQGRSIL